MSIAMVLSTTYTCEVNQMVEWKEWRNYDFVNDYEYQKARNEVLQDLIKSGRIVTGFEHQGAPDGCPYVNGLPLALSFRSWGNLMAHARNLAENTNKYDYVDFAWD